MVHKEEERRGRGRLRQEIVLMALCERETVVGLDFEALWGGRIDEPMEMKNSSVGESLIVTPTYQTSLVRTSPFGSFRTLGPRHQLFLVCGVGFGAAQTTPLMCPAYG